MKDVAGLLQLAFKLAHEVSEATLDIERAPGLRNHRLHGSRIADCGISVLARVAAAASDYADPQYHARLQVPSSLRAARDELGQLRQYLNTVLGQRYVEESQMHSLIARADELTAVLMALGVEIRGERRVA